MDARTQLFLSELLWGLDIGADSDLRPHGTPFELWADRNRIARTVEELEARELVEPVILPDLTRILCLARSGIVAALGGRDPPVRWGRQWDHQWRHLIYDIPRCRGTLRARVLRKLRGAHFGCLQGSLWITPDPWPEIRSLLSAVKVQPRTIIMLEGRPVTGETDRNIVAAAWNFRRINRLYQQYLNHISGRPPRGEALRHWRERENHLWLRAVRSDPLLPRALHPPGYLGRLAYERRRNLLRG